MTITNLDFSSFFSSKFLQFLNTDDSTLDKMNPLVQRALAWIIEKHFPCHHNGYSNRDWNNFSNFMLLHIMICVCMDLAGFCTGLSALSWDFQSITYVATELKYAQESISVLQCVENWNSIRKLWDLAVDVMNFCVLNDSLLLEFLDITDKTLTCL